MATLGQKFKRVLVLEEYPFLNQRDSSAGFSQMGSAVWRVVACEKVFAQSVMSRPSSAGEEYRLGQGISAAGSAGESDKIS